MNFFRQELEELANNSNKPAFIHLSDLSSFLNNLSLEYKKAAASENSIQYLVA